ncbi:DsbE family thiol:disulfide interchange protein [Halorhodospira neutriphila]|uniref:DsbE family thiol:disulfide interchange protein n=1 Tax=Halorhodospira neutriphila TaxID=168379 RepID=A0ABS1E6A3_9GAMM|nr:DsbE family thiol:disulfide interchange protein [Halorhodospira neutriphila]MBK1726265.1 DsbE family thiol:disulfide interchange protein [Halorhodospira neutriphila]
MSKRSALLRFGLPLTLVLVLLGLFYVGLGTDTEELPSPLVGEPAPAFELPSLQEPQTTLTEADFTGEVALVNVWASWCRPCRQELPYLQEIAKRDVPVYGFNYRDSRQNARRFLEAFGNPYDKIAFDPEAEAGMDWGVYATPETYVLDAQGIIRHKHIGPINAKVLQEDLLPLIEKLKAEQQS